MKTHANEKGNQIPQAQVNTPPPPEGRGPGGGVNREDNPHPYGMYTTTAKPWLKAMKVNARANRHNPTPAENHLWQAVRGSKLGAAFRRQHAIQHFIVDFVCLAAWLIVEVDGGVHGDVEQAEYDGGRTHELQECGFLVLRFTNEQVLYRTAEVLQTIIEHLNCLHPDFQKR